MTGMSPAIVTETVYGLAVNPTEGRDKWIPDEIHVISTEHGLVQVKDRLLKEAGQSRYEFVYKCLQKSLKSIKEYAFG